MGGGVGVGGGKIEKEPGLEFLQRSLEVFFNVVFPAALRQTQRTLMKSVFFLPKNLTEAQKGTVNVFLKAFSHNTEIWSTGFKK